MENLKMFLREDRKLGTGRTDKKEPEQEIKNTTGWAWEEDKRKRKRIKEIHRQTTKSP